MDEIQYLNWRRNDEDGYFISSTPTRAQTLKKKMFNYSNNKYTITTAEPFHLNSSEIKFKTTEILK